ncbi:sodium/glutamate symporter, partial [Aliarcobacter butzleri]|uniref:sodium/glutamate symporter n=1 Tax=Aliarcobacter butzleri TaxID=28197 RepID=UPI003AF46E33
TLIVALLVLLIGKVLVNNIVFLKRYNIPEPVAGGLVAALCSTVVHYFFGFSISTSTELQTRCMLTFFASIGLSASFYSLN